MAAAFAPLLVAYSLGKRPRQSVAIAAVVVGIAVSVVT